METWWQSLSAVNKAFAVAALFFSLMFLWQLIGMLLGMHAESADGGMDHGDVDHGGMDHADADHAHPGHHDAGAHDTSGITFTLLSFRSILAFATLFSWAGTLYLMTGVSFIVAMIYSLIWGALAMVLVAYVVYKLVQLQEIGNATVWSAIGEEGIVYMNIPEGGTGKIRVLVSGVMSYVNARSKESNALPAGMKVRVSAVLDNNTLEVEATEEIKGE